MSGLGPSDGWPRQPGRASGGPASDADLRRLARDLAARRLERLDALPRDLGARVRDLQDYDFLEPEARRQFRSWSNDCVGRRSTRSPRVADAIGA
jgi:hypothetical protein